MVTDTSSGAGQFWFLLFISVSSASAVRGDTPHVRRRALVSLMPRKLPRVRSR
ncbi:hypothetical protein AXF42_Ash000773 [Apostasia shenzhenica]|uniref:Uncharacterized protein n=1 Tax=Apostasia shenzhenica TaxID=1088818 RepID=A0A2I0AHB2_9ASPA|nr:hypothetical protein AXF42_Ash000773 [Apostasia shenzhenica]